MTGTNGFGVELIFGLRHRPQNQVERFSRSPPKDSDA